MLLLLSGGVMPLSCPGVVGVVYSVVSLVGRERVQFLVEKVWLCSGFATCRLKVAVPSLGFSE